jgi:K(+)-stimulated pyrophosphate-energized sodium pump
MPAPAPAPAPAPVVAAPVAAAAAPEPAKPAAPAVPATAKLYFATGSAVVDDPSRAKLVGIIDHLKAHPGSMAVLSGFHDPTGNKAKNEELALNRARAVRAVLGTSGIQKERIEMAKPAETTGGGPEQEARRVEVSVKP